MTIINERFQQNECWPDYRPCPYDDGFAAYWFSHDGIAVYRCVTFLNLEGTSVTYGRSFKVKRED